VSATAHGWRVGVDTGGTFTDLVAASPDGGVRLVKVRSTPSDPAAACFEALERALPPAGALDGFVLGTTIATNALLQRAGAPVIYLTTAGFEDTLFIQRIDRRGPYDLQWRKPKPYVERRRCVGVRERVTAEGEILTPLADDEIERVAATVDEQLAETPDAAVAISLLFSYVRPEHEQRLAARLRERFPRTPVSVSSEVAPVWREYERGNTTVVDVSVKQTVTAFADRLATGLGSRHDGGPRALMKSNGGQVPLRHAAERPSQLLLSGLAAGMIAGDHFARAIGSGRAVTLDMGGTSADVGVIAHGGLRYTGLVEIEWGLSLTLPIIDVSTIGAGGSSIAWVDTGGLLRVGPRSAGADPGPASYGRGGDEPTVTDANLLLGRLDGDFFLGGELPLDPELAAAAVERVAAPLGMTLEQAADAIVSVAVENMAGAIRLVTVDRGYDYRDFDLIAFGGAGPLHAAEIVRRMGMRRVVVPPSPGLVSAFGALIADERVDHRLTMVRRLDRPEAADLGAELAALASRTAAELQRQRHEQHADEAPALATSIACRYAGQNYEQDVPIDPTTPDLPEELARRFHAAHEQVYGYAMRDQPIETVFLAASAVARSASLELPPPPAAENVGAQTRAVFAGAEGWVDATIVRRAGLASGDTLPGPAVVEEVDSTTYVPAGFTASVHESRCLIVEPAT
jgi:N-methylhydantoinase A